MPRVFNVIKYETITTEDEVSPARMQELMRDLQANYIGITFEITNNRDEVEATCVLISGDVTVTEQK